MPAKRMISVNSAWLEAAGVGCTQTPPWQTPLPHCALVVQGSPNGISVAVGVCVVVAVAVAVAVGVSVGVAVGAGPTHVEPVLSVPRPGPLSHVPPTITCDPAQLTSGEKLSVQVTLSVGPQKFPLPY